VLFYLSRWSLVFKFVIFSLDFCVGFGWNLFTKKHVLLSFVCQYYFQLFSSGLAQKGEDNEGLDGFLIEDILKECKRCNKLVNLQSVENYVLTEKIENYVLQKFSYKKWLVVYHNIFLLLHIISPLSMLACNNCLFFVWV